MMSHFIDHQYFRNEVKGFSRTSSANQTLTKHYKENDYLLHYRDTIFLECHHSTKNVDEPTYGGISSSNELCLALLTHYCPENQICPLSKLTSCFSWPTEETLSKVFGFDLDTYEPRFTPELERYVFAKNLREINHWHSLYQQKIWKHSND